MALTNKFRPGDLVALRLEPHRRLMTIGSYLSRGSRRTHYTVWDHGAKMYLECSEKDLEPFEEQEEEVSSKVHDHEPGSVYPKCKEFEVREGLKGACMLGPEDKAGYQFSPGDKVRLTGTAWAQYGLEGKVTEVIGRDEVGPKIKETHCGSGLPLRIAEKVGSKTGFAATLVDPAPLAPAKGRDYYGGDTVLRFIEAMGLNFSRGNTVKYVSRAGKKDPAAEIEDLKKARDYIDREIENLEAAK